MDKLLESLGIKKVEKWHNYSIFIKTIIHYFGFKHKGKNYLVSQSKYGFVFSKVVKDKDEMLFIGYSINDLESAMRKELCLQN